MFAATRAAAARSAFPSTSTSPSTTSLRSLSASNRASQITRHLSSSSSPIQQDVYILGAARTPTAKFNGSYTTVPAPILGATAIKSALAKSGVPISKINEVYIGNVLSANIGQSPARQASIAAGLPESVDATTINKVCASGLKAVTLAAQSIQLGTAQVSVAGGMENMSRVPYYLPRASQQNAFGHMQVKDGLVGDGLWDVYNQIHMGNCAENTAKKYNISREEQDSYAIESYRRAQRAWEQGLFKEEIAPVTVPGKKGDTIIDKDEGFDSLKLEKIPTLKPAFVRDGTGTVTAANSSTLNDGASAVVLANSTIAREALTSHPTDTKPVLAKILSHADAAAAPIDFPTAPSLAVPIALERAGLSVSDVAVWEFNEAFAAVIRANAKILGLDNEEASKKVNPRGGAISLGHALGSSGSRILVTLLHELEVGEVGVAAICNGGGAASAVVVKRVDRVE